MFAKTMPLTRADKGSWLETIWDALHGYRENCIPEGEEYDPIWDDICTAMAWIEEEMLEAEKTD
jgi:hypothetical protein